MPSTLILDRVEQFLDYLSVERGSSTNTISSYRTDLLQFAVYFSRDVDEITTGTLDEIRPKVIAEFAVNLRNNGLKPKSTSRKIAAIRVRFIVKQIIFILRYHARIIVKLIIKTTIYIMLLKLMRVLRPFAQKKLLL